MLVRESEASGTEFLFPRKRQLSSDQIPSSTMILSRRDSTPELSPSLLVDSFAAASWNSREGIARGSRASDGSAVGTGARDRFPREFPDNDYDGWSQTGDCSRPNSNRIRVPGSGMTFGRSVPGNTWEKRESSVEVSETVRPIRAVILNLLCYRIPWSM